MATILFVQNGDYAEAYGRFASGAPETYRDQQRSVQLVEDLSTTHQVVVVAICDRPHDEIVRPRVGSGVRSGLRSIGVRYDQVTAPWVAALFADVAPDRLICRTPHHLVLRHAQRTGVPTLAQFADIFSTPGPMALYRNLRLRRTLVGPHLACVSNHSRNASMSLHKALFLPKTRIVPWDREVIQSPYRSKAAATDPRTPRLFYAGLLLESKGVDDLLRAAVLLRQRGRTPQVTLVGRGDPAPWQQRVAALGLEGAVTLPGLMPNADVLAQMHAHDAVIVPTRPDYEEGLPNTLREALAVRTPVIISDHPAFAGRLTPQQHCLVFRAGQAEDLATAVERLVDQPALYARLSSNAQAALEGLPFGLFWPRLWASFIESPSPDSDWIVQNSLASMLKGRRDVNGVARLVKPAAGMVLHCWARPEAIWMLIVHGTVSWIAHICLKEDVE